MTKGGSTKSKTLGRLIFGEKRKQHASPSRHRSSTRNGPKSGSNADLSTSAPPPIVPPRTSKKSINLHDWSLWRVQLNEQLATILTERRSDLRPLRQFLQTSSFYQKENHDENNGRLLFSIPRAKFRPEYLENLPTPPIVVPPEIPDIVTYEAAQPDERSSSSVNAIVPIQPMNGMRTMTRSAARCSFPVSDRIHSTLQKTVKDGNVLEKIKAFEMQAAAAAQAQSSSCVSSTVNSRMQSVTSSIQSVAQRTLSPTIVHPIRSIPSVSTRRDDAIEIPTHQSSRKGPNHLEAAQGDVILCRPTPSQDDDFSITAISSMALRSSKDHQRTLTLRSRQKRTTTPRRRWLKSGEKQEILIVKKKKKKSPTDNHRVYGVPNGNDENLDSIQTAGKNESDDEQPDQTNTYDDEQPMVATLQRRSTGKTRKKFSSTDADDRLTRTIDRQGDQSELDDDPSDGNVFIEDASLISRAQRQSFKKKSSPRIHLTRKSRSNQRDDEDVHTPVNDIPNGNATKKKQRACPTNPPTKQMSKQILQAIMNSMNPNHHQHHDAPNAEFFDNGPLTNPEETFIDEKN